MSDYGNVDWNGWCQPTLSLSKDTIYLAEISLNTFHVSPFTYPECFRAISCHEFGHALGVGHNYTSGERSIMKEATLDFYDYEQNLGNKLIAP